MRARQVVWNKRSGWTGAFTGVASLVLYFGTREALACGARYDELRAMFPGAHILGCSTGGPINNDHVNDDQIVAPRGRAGSNRAHPRRSRDYGAPIRRPLHADDLAHVFVLSAGFNVNGSEL